MTKLYFGLWVLLALVAAGFYITGNMNSLAGVIFGFFAFGMVFMGIISVLPTSVHESLIKH